MIRVALCTWCLAVKNLQCALIRKKFADILENHLGGPTGFYALLQPLTEKKRVIITQKGIEFLDTGSTITFQHCQDERQFSSAQGIERGVLVIDEATQISERLIRVFRAWCRMTPEVKKSLPEEYQQMFPRIIYTANPIGPSVGFFRRHFVKARPAFAIEMVDAFSRQYIPSRAEDNLSVDLEAHKARLAGIGDEGLARALDEGDWDAPVGDFLREWDEDKHVCPDFIPPAHWFRYRSFDWGTSEPFAVLWWAVSDGEPFKDKIRTIENGLLVIREEEMWFPRGALIAYREWYGNRPDKEAEGLGLRNEDLAAGIYERSPESYEKNITTLTDSLPFQDRGGKTIAETFADTAKCDVCNRIVSERNLHNTKCKETCKRGDGTPGILKPLNIFLTRADTSRETGWSQLRSLLNGVFIDANDQERTAMIFFTESCRAARDYLPALPRHPTRIEDAAEHGEATHIADCVRYAAMARTRVVLPPEKIPDTAKLSSAMTFDQVIEWNKKHQQRLNGSSY